MSESLDVLKLRVLLCFLNEEPKTCTVTGLAGVLGEGKQKVSRMLMALEREGLLDRSDPRRPCLTEAGRARAAYYEERTNVVLNHLLYEGLDIDSALHDAYAWALMSSDEGMALIRSSEQRYRAKYELRRQNEFGGAELCRRLGDGEYCFPFLIYREYVSGGTNLSMANEAFSHPCTLAVANGVGQNQALPDAGPNRLSGNGPTAAKLPHKIPSDAETWRHPLLPHVILRSACLWRKGHAVFPFPYENDATSFHSPDY